MNTLNKIPPSDMATEMSILGSMIISKDALYEGLERLNQDDFYSSANKIIYRALQKMAGENVPVDIITLSNQLRQETSSLEAIGGGGESYLSELTENVSTTSHVGAHVEILKGLRTRRELITAANEILNESYQGDKTIRDLKAVCERLINTALCADYTSTAMVKIGDTLSKAFSDIEDAIRSKDGITGVTSGFSELDAYTAGFHGGDLIVIAARPGMGKTGLMLCMAINALMIQKSPSLIFSCEMPAYQLTTRALSIQSSTNLHALRSGRVSTLDHKLLGTVANLIHGWDIWLDDTAAIKLSEVRSKIRRAYSEHKIGIVFLDYLQLMGDEIDSSNRNQQIEYNSRGLKAIAKEYDIPIVALAQLSRNCEQRPDKRPQLSDLRDSGAIEQDADLVAFIYRDCKYNNSADKTAAELIIAKQRNGSTGTIDLTFRAEYARFENRVVDSPESWQP